MKRFFLLICSLMLILSGLTGCGKKGKSEPKYPTYVTDAPRVPTAAPVPDTTDYNAEARAAFASLIVPEQESFSYTVTDGTATIIGYVGTETAFRIPETLGDCPVVGISATAFAGRNDLTVLALPATAEQLAAGVFADCTALTALQTTFPEAGYIGFLFGAGAAEQNNAPALRNIRYLELIGAVSDLPEKSFYGCKDLTAVLFPETVQTIGNAAFRYCEGLKYINADRQIGRAHV